MLFKATNIEEQLEKLHDNEIEGEKILESVRQILKKDTEQQCVIESNLRISNPPSFNSFEFDLLDTKKIYHIDHIKKICIDYRLRFLDTKYFKGQIPQEAFSKIKHLERQHNIEVNGFKIIAPSKLFKLEDKDDPILFAPIGNGYYYLIHKWGKDLHPLRKILVWPFKNIVNLAILVLLISCLCTTIIPDGLFTKSSSGSEKLILLFFMFKSVASVVIFYGFALGKNFNPAIWNSKYLKA